MTQASANGGLEILIAASIKYDLPSGLIGAKILRFATADQILTAREYCRIKHHYSSVQIENAINRDPLKPIPHRSAQTRTPAPLP